MLKGRRLDRLPKRNGRDGYAERAARLRECEFYEEITPLVSPSWRGRGSPSPARGAAAAPERCPPTRGAIVPDEGLGFEVEAATMDEFLRLLKKREEDQAPAREDLGRLRGAVFVARLREVRSSRYPFPKVTRRVVAAFARGEGVVCLSRITSNAVELPETKRTTEGWQRAVHEGVLAEITRGLEEAGLANEVPVYEGSLYRYREVARRH